MSGNLDMATGFKLSLYSLHQKLNFHNDYWVLSQHLREAENKNDPKLYISKAQNGAVQINAFYYTELKELTIEIVK